MIPKICDIWLRARDAGVLKPTQARIAAVADALIRALAQVGIVALVDEATGYQEEREKAELQLLLSKYLTAERLKWVSTFPEEFFKQIYRLNGWGTPVGSKRTPYIGKIINKIVYERLPKGVLEELQKKNPTDYTTKRRKWKHHQFLSHDLGHPDLVAHLQQLIVLMRVSGSWRQFIQFFSQAFLPDLGIQQELDFGENGN
jgi:hypothetical protein